MVRVRVFMVRSVGATAGAFVGDFCEFGVARSPKPDKKEEPAAFPRKFKESSQRGGREDPDSQESQGPSPKGPIAVHRLKWIRLKWIIALPIAVLVLVTA